MLVLSRKKGERIILHAGEKAITVEVLTVSGKKARLGIQASADVLVRRQEIRDRDLRAAASPLRG